MKEGKNKNYQRINNKIIDGFKAFIREHPTEVPSITFLCQKAGVNRTTFYKHYKDIDEIRDDIELETTKRMFSGNHNFIDFVHNPKISLIAFGDMLRSDTAFYIAMFNHSRISHIIQKICQYIVTDVKTKTPEVFQKFNGEDNLKIDIGYLVGGIITLYSQWLNGYIRTSLDHLANIVTEAITHALKQYNF